jgi:hypothetical protein
MIVVKLQGGLGNQMFQYATAYALAEVNRSKLYLDDSYLRYGQPIASNHVFRNFDLDIFPLKYEFASLKDIAKLKGRLGIALVDKVINKVVGRPESYFVESDFQFYPKLYQLKAPMYLDGYWQCYKYFDAFKEKIKVLYEPIVKLGKDDLTLMEDILSCGSVCLNVRRSDFITNPLHKICDQHYYERAVDRLASMSSNFKLFVFSDDIEWCVNNLKFAHDTYFVKHEFAGDKFAKYFKFMKACKHFIIPNSSFAWWAAYLSDNSNKIIFVPQRWYNVSSHSTSNLFPEGWNMLEV